MFRMIQVWGLQLSQVVVKLGTLGIDTDVLQSFGVSVYYVHACMRVFMWEQVHAYA